LIPWQNSITIYKILNGNSDLSLSDYSDSYSLLLALFLDLLENEASFELER
jgi:hypothetical protein